MQSIAVGGALYQPGQIKAVQPGIINIDHTHLLIIWIPANAILVQLDDGAERLVEDVLNEPNLNAIIADQAPHPSNVSGYLCKIR